MSIGVRITYTSCVQLLRFIILYLHYFNLFVSRLCILVFVSTFCFFVNVLRIICMPIYVPIATIELIFLKIVSRRLSSTLKCFTKLFVN